MNSSFQASDRLRIAILSILLALVVVFGWQQVSSFVAKSSLQQSLIAIELPSGVLSRFSGRPRVLRALVLPPTDTSSQSARGVMYHFPGFGAGPNDSRQIAAQLKRISDAHPDLSMWHLFVDVTAAGRYTYFTDSPTNGPYETAFVTEFIPEFERAYLSPHHPRERFLTGHSSGGWVALWLMLRHPDFFSGAWATSPDPADFRDFFGVNITPGSHQNMYLAVDGSPIPAARNGALGYDTLREYIAADLASNGGDLASYEAAFSELNAPQGMPMELFNRPIGTLNQETLQQWRRFDLRSLLSRQSPEQLAHLRSKLHIWVGASDDFFLERPTQSFCNAARAAAVEPECVVVPARGHRDLYLPHPQLFPEGLLQRILSQAASRAAR